MFKKIFTRFKNAISVDTSQKPEDKAITDYLHESMNELVENANNNEKKLDDFFLRQATIPNLFLTSAILSPTFVKSIKDHYWFRIFYFSVIVTFFSTYLFTIILTVYDKWNSAKNHSKSQKLYDEHKNKNNHEITFEVDQQIRKQITQNNPSYDNCFHKLLRVCEDSSRIINVVAIIIFLIIGAVVYYV